MAAQPSWPPRALLPTRQVRLLSQPCHTGRCHASASFAHLQEAHLVSGPLWLECMRPSALGSWRGEAWHWGVCRVARTARRAHSHVLVRAQPPSLRQAVALVFQLRKPKLVGAGTAGVDLCLHRTCPAAFPAGCLACPWALAISFCVAVSHELCWLWPGAFLTWALVLRQGRAASHGQLHFFELFAPVSSGGHQNHCVCSGALAVALASTLTQEGGSGSQSHICQQGAD